MPNPRPAAGEIELPGGAVEAVVRHLDREGVRRASRGGNLHSLGADQDQHALARTLPVRRRGERAKRRVDPPGAGDLARQQVGAPDEAGDEAVRRPVVDLVRGRRLHQPAVAEDGDAVGERERLVLVVRDEERGDVLAALDPAHLVAHRDPGRGVERGERLVQEQRARLERERARQRDTLLLAAGELGREPVAQAREPDELEHLAGAPPALAGSTPRTRNG